MLTAAASRQQSIWASTRANHISEFLFFWVMTGVLCSDSQAASRTASFVRVKVASFLLRLARCQVPKPQPNHSALTPTPNPTPTQHPSHPGKG